MTVKLILLNSDNPFSISLLSCMKPIKKRAQKAQIKKELMPITWYSSKCWG